MNHSAISQSENVDELLTVLASNYCSAALSHLKERSDEVTSVDDLASHLQKQDHGGPREIAVELHHSVIPRLEDVGAIEYDRVNKEIRYRGHSELESLLGI